MHDPRKPRPLTPRSISALVVDANPAGRWLAGNILNTLGVNDVASAEDAESAEAHLVDRGADVILVSGEQTGLLDGLACIRAIRRLSDARVRRLPIILIQGNLDRRTVTAGRDAGADELLSRPISPDALQQRLQMVIETPRPFIDSSLHIGPCRRRKNPADYHHPMRRAGERPTSRAPALVDQDLLARKTPIRQTLASLREHCAAIEPANAASLDAALADLKTARGLAAEQNDHALLAGLVSFGAYLAVAAPLGPIDQTATDEALEALEQLATLPTNYAEARDCVAVALGKTIQKKLAA